MILYTIGHSTRPMPDFMALLQREGIGEVADVRAFPASRRHPHFNRDVLRAALAAAGIAYSHHPALGGRRAPRPDSPNTGWHNASFRGYADHMRSAEFKVALEALAHAAQHAPTAIMCAEAVPWRCHRTLIADALVARGIEVAHILDGATQPHRLTPFAVLQDGELSYPAPAEPE